MPPKSSTDNKNLVDKSDPYYTNEDVEILYKIVVHAQNLTPSLPEREQVPTSALFAAYYALLPSIGIDADHDSRYARILFKIGGVRGDGSLFEKFEEVLSRMDIELQFDYNSEKNEAEDATKTQIQASQGSVADAAVAEHPRGRLRRNSESSRRIRGAGSGEKRVTRSRSHSAFSGVDSTNFKESIRDLPATRDNNRTAGQNQTTGNEEIESHEKGHDLRAWLNAGIEDDQRQPRSVSVSPYGSINVRQNNIWTEDPDLATSSTLSIGYSGERSVTDLHVPEMGQEHQLHPKITTTEFETLLAMKTALIEEHHCKLLLRQKWRQWCLKTSQLLEDNWNLELLAKHQDRRVLLRQAFDTWRNVLVTAHRRAETQRFFAHLERRASRARDLFVLTKALTHWAQTADDGIQWTSAARRHILRARYFQPWRDIAAVNELKVRRHILRKFFGIWQSNSLRVEISISTNVIRFEHQLVRRVYWTWFWNFWERKASPLWAFRSKRRCFSAWVARASGIEVAEKLAANHRSHQLKSALYSTWTLKQHTIARFSQTAVEFDSRVVYSKTLSLWYTACIRQCALRRAHSSVQLRLKNTILDRWAVRARQERQAAEIDRIKIKREAWVIWNDGVRCQALQVRIDGRLVLQALYRWVLAERLILADRLSDRRMMHAALSKMVSVSTLSSLRELRDTAFAEAFDSLSSKKNMFGRWRSRLEHHFQIGDDAARFGSPLALRKTFLKWSNRNQYLGQLEGWCCDASFYFLASRLVNSWKEATENSKRVKRRTAYAEFRRKKKIRFVSITLQTWRQRTTVAAEMRDHAIRFCSNKTVIIGMDIFDRWRARLDETTELHEIHLQNLLRGRLNVLRASLRELRRWKVAASTSFEDRCSSWCLKKWGREALQLRALEHVVSELREKYYKKSSRRMIVHWRQRALQKASLGRFGPDEPSPVNLSGKPGANQWSDFGEVPEAKELPRRMADENVSVATTVPGYMSTPSKQSLRARKERLISTTPSAPLLTPVERHLRAQYSGGSLSAFRKTRSATLSTNVEGFRDVLRQVDES